MSRRAAGEASVWDAEYARGGVPSSVRAGPSGALVDHLRRFSRAPGVALDIGCGKGRNARFLSELGWRAVGVDLSAVALSAFPLHAAQAARADIARAWPFADGAFDFAVDAFCFKHLIAPEEVALYAAELARVLKPGGAALMSLAPPTDGYYAACPREVDADGRFIVTDPQVGARSVLYDERDMQAVFAAPLRARLVERRAGPGLMHGREYARATDVYLIERA